MSECAFEIHPRIGGARLGNSLDEFYLSPESGGGLPIACDEHGNVLTNDDDTPQFVDTFKDSVGRLVALGAFVTGDGDISSFRGASGYWDDIADGYVTATVHLTDGTQLAATPGWLLVGSPKFAPELVNITTLYDTTMYDVAVRKMDAAPDIYDGADNADAFPQHDGYTPLQGFNPDYEVNFTTQIQPIIDRIQSYRWVADIPYLNDFAHPGFDLTDAGRGLASLAEQRPHAARSLHH